MFVGIVTTTITGKHWETTAGAMPTCFPTSKRPRTVHKGARTIAVEEAPSMSQKRPQVIHSPKHLSKPVKNSVGHAMTITMEPPRKASVCYSPLYAMGNGVAHLTGICNH